MSACEEVALQAKSGPRPTRTNGTPGKTAPRVAKPAPESSISAKSCGKKYPTCGPATKIGCPVCERFAPMRIGVRCSAAAESSGAPVKLPSSTTTLPGAVARRKLVRERLLERERRLGVVRGRAGPRRRGARPSAPNRLPERVEEHRVLHLLSAVRAEARRDERACSAMTSFVVKRAAGTPFSRYQRVDARPRTRG